MSKVLKTNANPSDQQKLFQFTQGVDVDCFLATQEVRVQKAWAKALVKNGILTQDECVKVDQTLSAALELMQNEKFDWRIEDEDIHMNLERFMTEKLGETGKRTHLGRSRNDLIATSLRLFVNDSLKEVQLAVSACVAILGDKAEQSIDQLVPGMTHLQHGQPIRLSHIFASYGWGLFRDLESIQFAQGQALAHMPLGSAALAGTTIDVDLGAVAKDLGFKKPTYNSYDSVGDRDFILSALNAYSGLAIHLSRMSEDFIIGSSTSVGILKLPKNWSTGSSIMPNKRNPDIPELIRAKSAHILSAHTNAQMLLKGLPSSYASDLHEMKKVFIDAHHEVLNCLSIIQPFLKEIEVDQSRASELMKKGHILATDIANQLTAQGISFREAYATVAALVADAESKKISVEEIPSVKADGLTFESAIEARKNTGGTSRLSCLAGIAELKKSVKEIIEKK